MPISPNTISFHYCFGPEQRLIDAALRRPADYRKMSDEERAAAWPKQNQLGGYSYVARERQDMAQVWKLLLDRLVLSDCAVRA